jgi:hypothetical protein
VCWVGFNPIPVEPNRHLGQAGEVTPLWAGFPPTRGLGLNTCQNTCCQTKPTGAAGLRRRRFAPFLAEFIHVMVAMLLISLLALVARPFRII